MAKKKPQKSKSKAQTKRPNYRLLYLEGLNRITYLNEELEQMKLNLAMLQRPMNTVEVSRPVDPSRELLMARAELVKARLERLLGKLI